MNNFNLALAFTCGRLVEGGISDVSADHGGLTDNGVTQATYDEYRDHIGLPRQPVTLMTHLEEINLYLEMFWVPARCAVMSQKISIAHFDWSVNHGVTGAMEMLQACVCVKPDGIFGSITNRAINEANQVVLLNKYLTARNNWYTQDGRLHSSQDIFENGWHKRVIRLRAYLEALK